MTSVPTRVGLLLSGLILLAFGTFSTSWWKWRSGGRTTEIGLRYFDGGGSAEERHLDRIFGNAALVLEGEAERHAGWVGLGEAAWFGGMLTALILLVVLFVSLGNDLLAFGARWSRIGIVLCVGLFLAAVAFVLTFPAPGLIETRTPGLGMFAYFLGTVLGAGGCLTTILAARGRPDGSRGPALGTQPRPLGARPTFPSSPAPRSEPQRAMPSASRPASPPAAPVRSQSAVAAPPRGEGARPMPRPATTPQPVEERMVRVGGLGRGASGPPIKLVVVAGAFVLGIAGTLVAVGALSPEPKPPAKTDAAVAGVDERDSTAVREDAARGDVREPPTSAVEQPRAPREARPTPAAPPPESARRGTHTPAPAVVPEPERPSPTPRRKSDTPRWAEVSALQSREAERLRVPVAFEDELGIRYVLVPSGTFTMGTDSGAAREGPAHRVQISRAFYMSVHEITQSQWRRVMGTRPGKFRGDDRPVEMVSWHDAVRFTERAAARRGVPSGLTLPTEAQWEHACRAGTRTAYSFGDGADRLGSYAWYEANSGKRTQPVGTKRANPWGLFDMHGNVWEWCLDAPRRYRSKSERDPDGGSGGEIRAYRGGSWYFAAGSERSSHRQQDRASARYDSVGFRVACPVDER